MVNHNLLELPLFRSDSLNSVVGLHIVVVPDLHLPKLPTFISSMQKVVHKAFLKCLCACIFLKRIY